MLCGITNTILHNYHYDSMKGKINIIRKLSQKTSMQSSLSTPSIFPLLKKKFSSCLSHLPRFLQTSPQMHLHWNLQVVSFPYNYLTNSTLTQIFLLIPCFKNLLPCYFFLWTKSSDILGMSHSSLILLIEEFIRGIS